MSLEIWFSEIRKLLDEGLTDEAIKDKMRTNYNLCTNYTGKLLETIRSVDRVLAAKRS